MPMIPAPRIASAKSYSRVPRFHKFPKAFRVWRFEGYKVPRLKLPMQEFQDSRDAKAGLPLACLIKYVVNS